ncbi:hypothetical protein, partial [Staphylococcus epidermidis]|uniref:hypothetical protein n=1 Tax=Staphylococcus epidermidis TaxID=1282 RepID=UPI00119CD824
GAHTPLSHIIKLVHHPQTSKPPIQPLPHIISPYFLPILLPIPIFTFIISISLLHPAEFQPPLLPAIAVLLIPS